MKMIRAGNATWAARAGRRVVPALLACGMLSACSSKPPPPPPPPPTLVQARVITAANVNPDVNGRPSPVVVRVYDLKSVAAFESGEFFSLWDKDQSTLGPEMAAREEYLMTPRDEKKFDCSPDNHAAPAYFGVIAAFRDIEHTRWRATVAVPRHKTTDLTVILDAHGVSIIAKQRDEPAVPNLTDGRSLPDAVDQSLQKNLPSTSAPSGSVPSVSTPSVSAPSVSAPSVSAPSVSMPSLPSGLGR